MSCDRTWKIPPITITVASATARFEPLTEWFPVSDGASVSAYINATTLESNFGFYLAVQYAAIRADDPSSTPTTIGSQITSTGKVSRLATLSASGQMWARLGLSCERTAAGAEVVGEIGVELGLHQCARIVGSRQIDLPNVLSQASGSALDNAAIYPLAPFMPTVGSPKFKATVVARDMLNYGSVEDILIYRTATDPTEPDSWSLLEASTWHTPSAANDERNTGEETPTVTDKAYVQPGIAIRRSSSGSAIRGDFDVTLMVIR